MTTLVEFFNQESALYKSVSDAAQAELAAAQTALNEAKKQLQGEPDKKVLGDSDKLVETTKKIAAARAQLATASVPSDVAALNLQIRDLIITQRHQQGAVLDDQEAIAAARARADAASAAVARGTARLADAKAKLAQATADAKDRDEIKNVLDKAPYKTLQADAAAFDAGPVVAAATTQLNVNFPPTLQAIAGLRRATRVKRLTALQGVVEEAETALGTVSAHDQGVAGTAAQKAIAFRQAERRVRTYLATAKLDFERAQTVMGKLQAIHEDATHTLPDILTPQQKLDVAESDDRKNAEKEAEKIGTDRDGLYDAEKALSHLIAIKLADPAIDIDALPADADIPPKKAAIDAARTKLKNTKATFDGAADSATVDQWEAIVPDAAWAVLLEFEEGKAALARLSDTDPAALITTMTNAEKDYAAELTKVAKAQRRQDALGDEIAFRRLQLDNATAALPGQLTSVIRGDND